MIVVIDCHAIGHRVKHSMTDLSYDNKRTGIIFGFLEHTLKYAEKFETNVFIFAWDSRKSYRNLEYPFYKEHKNPNSNNDTRTEDEIILDEIARKQFNELRTSVLPRLGFTNIFMQTGCEADDIIAAIVKDIKRTNQTMMDIIVVSRDGDLYQLLDDCNMYDPQTHKTFTANDLMNKWGVTPTEWIGVKCLAGCRGDGVPNIYRVREVTAVKFIKGKLTHGEKYESIISSKGQSIAKRNIELVKLPHSKTKKFKVNLNETLYTDDFVEVFEDYGFQSFLTPKRFNKWRRCFKLRD